MLSKSARKMRKWRKANPEKQREVDRRWRQNNLKKARAKNRAWYKKNRAYKLAQNALYHRNNRKKVAARHRLVRRRMTQEQHDDMLRKQRSRCAICRKKFLKTPHIDHSHKTGENRGLLCQDCNLGLGRFKDSITSLRNAINYLGRKDNGNR